MTPRLFVYGTLAPGRSNAFMLDGLEGTWEPATSRGTVHRVGWGGGMDYPGLVLDEEGERVSGLVFTSPALTGHWARLDAFEGRDYRRILTRVRGDDGREIEAHVYVLREDGASPRLRPVVQSDLEIFFRHQQDEAAVQMAAFTAADPTDRGGFDAHWARIRADESILIRTVVDEGRVAGHVASFEQAGRREVTYWLGRASWGRGIASRALATFLALEPARPIFAAAAADNAASLRVLQKCGFQVVATDRGFANARGGEIEEIILELSAAP